MSKPNQYFSQKVLIFIIIIMYCLTKINGDFTINLKQQNRVFKRKKKQKTKDWLSEPRIIAWVQHWRWCQGYSTLALADQRLQAQLGRTMSSHWTGWHDQKPKPKVKNQLVEHPGVPTWVQQLEPMIYALIACLVSSSPDRAPEWVAMG